MFPLVVGFPVNPAVVGTGGTAPSAETWIPIHSTSDGELILVKYFKSRISRQNGSNHSIRRYNTGDRKYHCVSKYCTFHEIHCVNTFKGL
jgi:hypothetical protein